MQGLEVVLEIRQIIFANIGSDRPAGEDDTFKAKHAFQAIGYYDEPSWGMTPYPDQPLFDGIKKFQKDKGLFQDALMEPKGETVTALNKALGKLNARSAVHPAALSGGTKAKIRSLEIEKRELLVKIRKIKAQMHAAKTEAEKNRLNDLLLPIANRMGAIDAELEFLRKGE